MLTFLKQTRGWGPGGGRGSGGAGERLGQNGTRAQFQLLYPCLCNQSSKFKSHPKEGIGTGRNINKKHQQVAGRGFGRGGGCWTVEGWGTKLFSWGDGSDSSRWITDMLTYTFSTLISAGVARWCPGAKHHLHVSKSAIYSFNKQRELIALTRRHTRNKGHNNRPE